MTDLQSNALPIMPCRTRAESGAGTASVPDEANKRRQTSALTNEEEVVLTSLNDSHIRGSNSQRTDEEEDLASQGSIESMEEGSGGTINQQRCVCMLGVSVL